MYVKTPFVKTAPVKTKIKDLFSTLTEDGVPDLVRVSSTNHYKTLFTVVVNTSIGGSGGWSGICSPVSDAPTTSTTTGMYNSSFLEGRV